MNSINKNSIDVPNGKSVYREITDKDEGSEYAGYMKKNYESEWVRHGSGKIIFLSGAIYEGEWFEDKMHG